MIGCEVVSEVEDLDVVYGIVTNYIQWNFLRITSDTVEIEGCSVHHRPEGPEKESIRNIAEKIYSMLSDEESPNVEG